MQRATITQVLTFGTCRLGPFELMRHVIPLVSRMAAFLAVTGSVVGGVIGQETFEAPIFSPIWTQTNKVVIQTKGGAEPTHGFAHFGSAGSQLQGNLASNGLSDFYIEFSFRTGDATNRQFHFQVSSLKDANSPFSASAINLYCDGVKGWGFCLGDKEYASWQPIAGLPNITPDSWYRLRFIGRDWGGARACFSLQLSLPDGNKVVTPATNLIYVEGSGSRLEPARHFAFTNTRDSNAGFDVAEVTICEITPYKGPVMKGVDATTLSGKVMCGYQGWFGAPGDGNPERGWRHWTKQRGPLADGNAKVDLWPDVSELNATERFLTDFKLPDGRTAEVFSSFQKPTVLRHFNWMKDYGIDGVFVQRFANGLQNRSTREYCNTVLANCREGANLNGRAYAVMYDLSGLRSGRIDEVINDWRALRREMVITDDSSYLHHRGKPVVAVWGVGFNDHRDYSLEECRRFIEFLKHDPEAGGCTVMLGVPAHWRELKADAVNDPLLLDIVAMADIVSPWTVGRYTNPEDAASYAEHSLKPDLVWCHERGIECLPVVFPGFSWHNMYDKPSDQIPRLHGQFLWSQILCSETSQCFDGIRRHV
ncbi:hypothetical protein Cflav_PD5756 [Pedosphaera parvula Ellin514]|uniref:Xylosidase/arabinosidase n=2 Tax=Pedosphaera TaxID=1032526 RepID=B9XAT6_PEDPL|nr:hypothetical protein Cflav_PD5756 [Pedosphaera parvula Ellin514]